MSKFSKRMTKDKAQPVPEEQVRRGPRSIQIDNLTEEERKELKEELSKETPEEKKAKKKKRKKKERKRFLIKFSIIAAIVAVCYFYVFAFIPQQGNEMFPVVKDGDLVITLKIKPAYQVNALVGYKAPKGKKRIGRIVACGGDEVDVSEEGRLLINGLIVSEEIFYPTEIPDEAELPCKVPKGSYYILNDHRTDTNDSREFGVIKEKNLLGTSFFLFRRRSF